MSASFTPGPWTIFRDDRPYVPGIEALGGSLSIVVYGDPEEDSCGVNGRTDEEAEANANLIAAAPDLYTAGIDALRELDCLAACIYHDDQREEVQAFADKFRAALARARGAQP